jgi:hypothetical protein
MKHDSVEQGWKQLQQRLEQKFCKYFQNGFGTGESKQKNPSCQHHTLYQNNEERMEINN